MIKHHFEGIQHEILKNLFNAKESIWLAVAWFTDVELWTVLTLKAKIGVSVEVILLDDDINRGSSIKFESLTNYGGKIYWIDKYGERMLHNKFCVIDSETVITGSYNWTNKAQKNLENVDIYLNELESANQYGERFLEIIDKSTKHIPPNNNLFDGIFKSRYHTPKTSKYLPVSQLRPDFDFPFEKDDDITTFPKDFKFRSKANDIVIPTITSGDLDWWESLSTNWRNIFLVNIQNNYSTENWYKHWFEKAIHMPLSPEMIDKILNLETLSCRSYPNEIQDLNPIRKLSKLKHLNCYGVSVKSIEPLENLLNLETIHFGLANIEDSSEFINLSDEQKLYINSIFPENLIDFQYVKKLIFLKEINVKNNNVANFEYIKNLLNLTTVKISGTNIEDISPILDLKNLVSLTMEGVKINSEQIKELLKNSPKCRIIRSRE